MRQKRVWPLGQESIGTNLGLNEGMTPPQQHPPTRSLAALQRRASDVGRARFDFVLRRPVWVLVGALLIVVALTPTLLWLRVDLSFAPLYSEDARQRRVAKEIEGEFGDLGSGMIGVLVESYDVLSNRTLRRTRALVANLQARPDIKRVLSAPTLSLPSSRLSQRPTEALCAGVQVERCRQRILGLSKMAPRVTRPVLTPSRNKTLIWIETNTGFFELLSRAEEVETVDRLAKEEFSTEDAQATLVGYSVVEVEYERLLWRSALSAAGLTVVAICLLLFLWTRRLRAVVGAFVGLALGLPVCFFAMAFFGWPVTLVTAALPTLLLMVGVADSVHFLSAYSAHRSIGHDSRQSVARAMSDLWLPCVLTTLTTVIGFVSLGVADLAIIREFGFAATVGVAAVHLFNLVCLPAFLVVFPFESTEKTPGGGPRNQMRTWVHGLHRRAGALSIVGAIALVGMAAAATQLETNQFFNRDVDKEHPLRSAQERLEVAFPGFLGPDVVIRRKDGAKVTSENALVAIQIVAEAIERAPEVTRVFAPTDIVDALSLDVAALDASEVEGQRPHKRVPPMVWPMALEALHETSDVPLLSKDLRAAVLLVRVNDIGTQNALTLIKRVEKISSAALPDEYAVQVGGRWVQAQTGMDQLVADLVRSFCLALALVLPFLWMAARRWSLFLLALLPNVAPLLGALGIMGLMGMPMRIGTAIVCAIALGIAVDDTLHFVHSIRKHAQTASVAGRKRAVEQALRTSGRALLATTFILVVGFLSLSLTELQVLRDLGRLGAATMVLAFVADVIWLPALWLWLPPTLSRSESQSGNKSPSPAPRRGRRPDVEGIL